MCACVCVREREREGQRECMCDFVCVTLCGVCVCMLECVFVCVCVSICMRVCVRVRATHPSCAACVHIQIFRLQMQNSFREYITRSKHKHPVLEQCHVCCSEKTTDAVL